MSESSLEQVAAEGGREGDVREGRGVVADAEPAVAVEVGEDVADLEPESSARVASLKRMICAAAESATPE